MEFMYSTRGGDRTATPFALIFDPCLDRVTLPKAYRENW
jgi:hypothetical protein